ncbi:MAG: hypothetical protein ABIJ74_04690 [archaeon]
MTSSVTLIILNKTEKISGKSIKEVKKISKEESLGLLEGIIQTRIKCN